MRKKNQHGILLSIVSVLLFGFMLTSGCQQGPPDHSQAAQSNRGKELFDKHCKVCHGKVGDGPMAEALKVQPPDLTKIMKRRNATTFPVAEVAQFVDGRVDVASHGPREMPVWGEELSEKETLSSEDELRGKLGEIIAYLMSIQDK